MGVGRSKPTVLAVLLLLGAATIVAPGCAGTTPVAESGGGLGQSLPTAAADNGGPRHTASVTAFEDVGPVVVELRTQRSAPDAAGQSEIAVAFRVLAAPEGEFVEVPPIFSLDVHGPFGTTRLIEGSEPFGVGSRQSGGSSHQGLVVQLPPGSERLELTVNIGPTELDARVGVQVEVDLDEVPVVEQVSPDYPYGGSATF